MRTKAGRSRLSRLKLARDLGARLGAWCSERALSQSAAADAAKIPQSAWSLIVRGLRLPSLSQAFRIEALTAGSLKARDWVTEADLRVDPPQSTAIARTG